MTLALPKIDRRRLLIGGGTGVGLVVAFLAWPRRVVEPDPPDDGEQAFGAFLRIATDGRVTIAIPQAETGQGAWTALAQIAADELGAAWDMVAVAPARVGSGAFANLLSPDLAQGSRPIRLTAASTSVRAFEQPLREAAATAREMLCSAAAERWGIAANTCRAEGGFVHGDGRRLAFAELAVEASRLPATKQPPLRRGPLSGASLPRLDLPPKSDGSFRFAGDVRLPEMLFASARLAPPGGRLAGLSRRQAEAIPGVERVVVARDWVAVVASDSWIAERAIRAAGPRFSGPAGLSREGFRAVLDEALESGRSEALAERGDYRSAVRRKRPLAATYWVAPAMHLGLEPLTATARLSGGRLELWAASQAPDLARAEAARASGLAESQVAFYPMPVGDSGGRAIEADLAPVAAVLARETGRPVQVTMAHHSSQNIDRVAPPALVKVSAVARPGGGVSACKMRVATVAGLAAAIGRLSGRDSGSAPDLLAAGDLLPPYAIPDLRIEAAEADLPLAAGYLRSHPQRMMVFAAESFVDELARATGAEPLAFRMAMLGGNPRLARCIATAASLGEWDGGGDGSTSGLAAASLFGSHIGLLANATISAGQQVEVHRLVAAVDCGRVVNPALAMQQVESGLLWALGLAQVREPEWIAGMPRSRPLGGLGLPRLAGTPRVEVRLLPSNAPPGGLSGLAPAVLAPALANAIAAGSGRRLRDLPFDLGAVA